MATLSAPEPRCRACNVARIDSHAVGARMRQLKARRDVTLPHRRPKLWCILHYRDHPRNDAKDARE